MQVSLRVPPETIARLNALAKKTGKSKTALILEALHEKYGLTKNHSQMVHDLAGWMSQAECNELRNAIAAFDAVDESDWQ
jgi:predicted transcriptional regulator